MRLLLPPLSVRRKVDSALVAFFEEYQQGDFDTAIGLLAQWYEIPRPKVTFFTRLNAADTIGGLTFEDGQIHLQHPEDYKRSSTSNSSTRRTWVRTVIHEWAHYVLWANAEHKAELYERRFVAGLNPR